MKTTKKQFKLFCDEFKQQVERMGLIEWRLDFFHEDCGGNFSEVVADYLNRVARVSLNLETFHTDVEAFIIETTLHEALELLVMDLYALANAAFKTEDEVIAVRHTLVRRLEKLL